MAATNFDLAPASKTVDGLAAVPIDIQSVTATLTFDAATLSGTGDATLELIVGPGGGCPIFDLRQTISSAWLDGAPLAPAQLALHDFGGGTGAELRVVETVLAAGSAHTLRVAYTLGTPQASTAGSYQPAVTWSAGPRLAFNFGFTDLGPGRYLEAWVPANLIFDQFDLTIELQLLNTGIAHTVISNGTVATLGPNRWSIVFAARSTAFSPLVELRATDTLASHSGSVLLPLSGAAVTIEAWKLVGGVVDLAARVADIAAWLVANEGSAGQYLHGGRFVAFFNVGGMEYDGGTTTAEGALRHEVFHSWWGRGLKPASQTDAWWDEAWNVYAGIGGPGTLPFDFTSPPVELSSRNPWVRRTPSASYSSGERFFNGVAALTGAVGLLGHMKAFYAEHHARPATTPQLEEFLLCRGGEPTLVDAFHRFVYGFADPSAPPDLWIKDDPADPGSHLWAGTFWDSPDLWIRNADDGGITHEPPEYGQDNWFHARVRNRSATGTARHFVVAFNVKPWVGTEFVYPGDFLPGVAAVAAFELGPGETRIVKARWPAALVPPAGTHVCWLAAALARSDRPVAGARVWEHNNLAQKNLVVADVVAGDWFVVSLVIDRLPLRRPTRVALQLRRPPRWAEAEAALLHAAPAVLGRAAMPADDLLDDFATRPRARPIGGDEHLDCGGIAALARPALAEPFMTERALAFPPGRTAELPVRLAGRGQMLMKLALRAPANAAPDEIVRFDLLQLDPRKRVTGGLAVALRCVKRGHGANSSPRPRDGECAAAGTTSALPAGATVKPVLRA